MKNKIFSCLVSLALVLSITACKAPVEKTFDLQLGDRLNKALQDVVENPETKFPGSVLYVSSPEFGTWVGAAGLGNLETGAAMRPENRFRAASILKPFIAVVILQLMEKDRFSLADPMTAVLPEKVTSKFSAGDKITIYMLLNHTSGIPDWLTEAMMGEIAANPQRIWDVLEYLDVAAEQEPYFPPGKGWKYSNTDYNLLGLVIEQVTERSWRKEVQERIIERLNLEDTRLPEPGDLFISDKHAHGYLDMGGNIMDFTQIDSSMAGAAGGHALVTTTADLARFLDALLAGELFENSGTLDKMLAVADVPDGVEVTSYEVGYGLGIMKYILPGNIEMFGHPGGTGGFQSFVYYLPHQNLTISGMMNNTESDQFQILSPALEVLFPEYVSLR